ncbi:histidine kinase [Halobacteriales archaeon QS_4_62_28]|nr:MAG: histidine kinase [Halobacteriales archaeon QS_4_62_28]
MAETHEELSALLIEDNPGDAKLVEHHLDSPTVTRFVDTVSLTHVETLDDATSVASGSEFDIVLLDLGLDATTGIATLDVATDRLPDVPIIVLTGMNDSQKAMEAIERGAQDYLPKDELDGDRLVRALRYAVARDRQQQRLERRTEQMEFFNSILRHDILNGMNVIRSRGELLEAELGGERAEHAETVVTWSKTLIDLTEKVQSTLTMVTDDEVPDLERVDLEAVIDAEVKRVRQMDGIGTVTAECPKDATAMADDLFADVIGNLLTNAVEHSDNDTTVSVTVSTDDETVQIAVADDGPGILPSERERIFGRGEQHGGSSGDGFGLYFVDSMVSSYGGSVWVEESDTGGARFVIELYRPGGAGSLGHKGF